LANLATDVLFERSQMNVLTHFLESHKASIAEQRLGVTISLVRPNAEGKLLFFDETKEIVQHLFSVFTKMTAGSFGIPLDESKDDGTRQHVQGVDALMIAHSGENVLGFASGFFPREEITYLHGVAIAPEAKGCGVGLRLVKALVETSGLKNLAFTTQNPIMYCLLRDISQHVYPSPEDQSVPLRLHDRTCRLMQDRSGVFEPATGISRNLYSKCLYASLPESSDHAVNRWFEDSLKAERGNTRDAFCFIGEGIY
jgi:hypothetical protein